MCWTAAYRPASPALAQFQDGRRRLESGARDLSGFLDKGSLHTGGKGRQQHPTACRGQGSGVFWGRRDHQLSRTDLRLAHWLPGKPAEG